MLFKKLKILDIGTKRFSNSESPCHPNASHQVSAQSDLGCDEMRFEEFQDGCHGGNFRYWNKTILAILNFNNTPMPPIKFELNQIYHSGADVIRRSSRWLPFWHTWMSERNHSSSSKSPCCPDVFHQVFAPSD